MANRAHTPGEIALWIEGKSLTETTEILKEWSVVVAEIARREGWREGYDAGASDYGDGWG